MSRKITSLDFVSLIITRHVVNFAILILKLFFIEFIIEIILFSI